MSILDQLKERVSQMQSSVSELAQRLVEVQETLGQLVLEEQNESERSAFSRDTDNAGEADGSDSSDERNDRFIRSENGLTPAQKDDVQFFLNADWPKSEIAQLFGYTNARTFSAIKKKVMTEDEFEQRRRDMSGEFSSFSLRVQAMPKLRALLGVVDVDDDDDNNSSNSSNNNDSDDDDDNDDGVVVTTSESLLMTGMPPSGWSDADTAVPLTPPPPRSTKAPPTTKKLSSTPLSAVVMKPAPTSESKLSKKRKTSSNAASALPPTATPTTRTRRRSAPTSEALAVAAAPKEFAHLEEIADSSGYGALFLPEATDFFKTSKDWTISFDGTYRWVADMQFYVRVKK